MSKLKDENFYQISGWMLNRLHLKGAELQTFAIVYGFSQDGESVFSGSLSYLCEWLGVSKPTAIKALAGLVEKALIKKEVLSINGVTFNRYRANLEIIGHLREDRENLPPVKNLYGGSKETLPGSKETLLGGGKETLPNKKELDNKDINKEIEKEEKSAATAAFPPFLKIQELFNGICQNLPHVSRITDSRKKAIAARWKENGKSLEAFREVFQKAEDSDFLTGNNDRGWTATFDWLLKPSNFAKVLEGNYDRHTTTRGETHHDHEVTRGNTESRKQPVKDDADKLAQLWAELDAEEERGRLAASQH